MKFKDSSFFNSLTFKPIHLPFGTFYLFEDFLISEINAEIHFDWQMVEILISNLVEHYGKDINIAYISNRINSYSFDPSSWTKFEKDYNFVVASAIVSYTNRNVINATIEKHISQNSIKRCSNLNQAIGWVTNLKEFQK